MVTDTRTTIRSDTNTFRTDNSPAAKVRADNANQAALWIVLAVVAFAALGYAFYHYSNPANNPQTANGTPATTSEQVAPAANDNTSSSTNANTQTSPNGTNNNTNGTVMNNDTSTAPNTGTPTNNSDASGQPSTATGSSTDSTTNSSSTAQ